MPLFECSKCHCADNTATAFNFWPEYFANGKPPLCSECDQEQGEWHCYFAKQPAADAAKSDPPDAGWIWWDGAKHLRINAREVVRRMKAPTKGRKWTPPLSPT